MLTISQLFNPDLLLYKRTTDIVEVTYYDYCQLVNARSLVVGKTYFITDKNLYVIQILDRLSIPEFNYLILGPADPILAGIHQENIIITSGDITQNFITIENGIFLWYDLIKVYFYKLTPGECGFRCSEFDMDIDLSGKDYAQIFINPNNVALHPDVLRQVSFGNFGPTSVVKRFQFFFRNSMHYTGKEPYIISAETYQPDPKYLCYRIKLTFSEPVQIFDSTNSQYMTCKVNGVGKWFDYQSHEYNSVLIAYTDQEQPYLPEDELIIDSNIKVRMENVIGIPMRHFENLLVINNSTGFTASNVIFDHNEMYDIDCITFFINGELNLGLPTSYNFKVFLNGIDTNYNFIDSNLTQFSIQLNGVTSFQPGDVVSFGKTNTMIDNIDTFILTK